MTPEHSSHGSQKMLRRGKIVVCVLLFITFLAGVTNEHNVTILRETFVGSTLSPIFNRVAMQGDTAAGDADMTKRNPHARQCTQDYECGKGECWVGDCYQGSCIGWWTCV
jgi:hypothetical protein